MATATLLVALTLLTIGATLVVVGLLIAPSLSGPGLSEGERPAHDGTVAT